MDKKSAKSDDLQFWKNRVTSFSVEDCKAIGQWNVLKLLTTARVVYLRLALN